MSGTQFRSQCGGDGLCVLHAAASGPEPSGKTLPLFGNLFPAFHGYTERAPAPDRVVLGCSPLACTMFSLSSHGGDKEAQSGTPGRRSSPRGATPRRNSASGANRAAEYVRMSTEHQKYSTENQAEAIRQYAARRGLTIVRTYADEGKSGLRLDGRDALKQLIADVQTGTADYTTILVYD